MNILLVIVIFVMTASLHAETLSLPSFRIDVEEGWVHSIERAPQGHQDRGDMISMHSPNGVGTLKMQAYSVSDSVSKEVLRNMTNVDSSKSLTWQNWGDYSGYQYNYLERDSFYRQWWLTNERTIIFITYNCDAESKDNELDQINKMVDSLKVNQQLIH